MLDLVKAGKVAPIPVEMRPLERDQPLARRPARRQDRRPRGDHTLMSDIGLRLAQPARDHHDKQPRSAANAAAERSAGMKITVMGSGGVGGYFGARLAAAGNDVTFVARGSHLAAMRKGGLRLDSDIGKLHLEPGAGGGRCAARSPAADAIIFAVKLRRHRERRREPEVAGGQGSRRLHLPERRGERRAHRPRRRRRSVVPGVARIASHIIEPGVIRQTGNFARIEFAESRRQAERAHGGVPQGLQGGRHRRRRSRPTSAASCG